MSSYFHPPHGDGDVLQAGTVIADVRGSLATVLVAERTALNFLGHLSGIATRVAEFVAIVDIGLDIQIDAVEI